MPLPAIVAGIAARHIAKKIGKKVAKKVAKKIVKKISKNDIQIQKVMKSTKEFISRMESMKKMSMKVKRANIRKLGKIFKSLRFGK